MRTFMKANAEYQLLVNKYTKKDGIKAILLYLLFIASCFFLGYLFTTSLSVEILNSSHIVVSILQLIIGFAFIWFSKDKLNTVGLTVNNLGKSLLAGVVGSILLLAFIAISSMIAGANHISFQLNPLMVFCIFMIGAVSEEIVFRGYIQTRITGIIKNGFVASCINAILFLSIHYPVKWIVSGEFSLGVLSGFYVLCLILLHFLCDLVYRKTNCLWGSIVLHFLYNLFTAMIIIR